MIPTRFEMTAWSAMSLGCWTPNPSLPLVGVLDGFAAVSDPVAYGAALRASASGELPAMSNAALPSVVRLRRQGDRRAAQIAALVLANLEAVSEDLAAGAIVVLETDRVRVRHLPLRTTPTPRRPPRRTNQRTTRIARINSTTEDPQANFHDQRSNLLAWLLPGLRRVPRPVSRRHRRPPPRQCRNDPHCGHRRCHTRCSGVNATWLADNTAGNTRPG